MKLSAVLLAGGESRRMGQDKATMPFREKPLWKIQLDLLRELQPLELLVSARTDPQWRPLDTKFVPDEAPSRGPLSGLAASLGQMRGTHLLALAVDMPLMTARYLNSLCDRSESGCGVLPKLGNRVEPLAAIYPAEARVDFAGALSGANFSLQNLTTRLAEAGRLRLIPVENSDTELFRNLNEPNDRISLLKN
jgi:molybdenum cofactor guanylyltransferase